MPKIKREYPIKEYLPKQLSIGALPFTVVQENTDSTSINKGCCGDCNYEQCIIRVDTKLCDTVAKITLWHEIIHAILFNAGMFGSEHDERIIDAMAHGIVLLLKNNPEMKDIY